MAQPQRENRHAALAFSVRQLLAAVGLIAVGLTALTADSQYWQAGLFTVSDLSLGVAVIAIICGRPSTHTFAAGYFVLGLRYFAACFLLSPLDLWRHQLITDRFFNVVVRWPLELAATVGLNVAISTQEVVRSLHAWFVIVVGWAGGSTARCFAAQRSREKAGPSRPAA